MNVSLIRLDPRSRLNFGLLISFVGTVLNVMQHQTRLTIENVIFCIKTQVVYGDV